MFLRLPPTWLREPEGIVTDSKSPESPDGGVNTEPQPVRSKRRCIALRKAPSWFNQDTEGLSKGFHRVKSLKWVKDKGFEASAWIIFFKTWTFFCVGIVLKFSQYFSLWNNYHYNLVKIKYYYLKKLNDHMDLDCITDSTKCPQICRKRVLFKSS